MRMPTRNAMRRMTRAEPAMVRSPFASGAPATVVPRRFAPRPGAGWIRCGAASVAIAAFCGCDWDLNRKSDGPPRVQPQTGEVSTKTAPLLATAPAASENARPSIDENMGRDFQGAIEWSLRNASGEQRNVRYLTRGNDARLQIDGLHGKGAFDALIWDEKISVIDNGQQTFTTRALDDIDTSKAKHDSSLSQIEINKTGERTSVSGVICERYEIKDGPTHVSACVSGLSGTFDVDKFETVSGVDVPAWAEKLLGEGYMPLQATARDAAGKQLYAVELVRYEAGSIDESMVSLPRTYRASDGAGVR
jgi:hypothetical protein